MEPLDNYTAGQNPKDFGMTTEMYHFAFKFYEPFQNLFKSVKIDVKHFYDTVVKNVNLIGDGFSSIFTSSARSSSIFFMVGIITIIIAGWLL